MGAVEKYLESTLTNVDTSNFKKKKKVLKKSNSKEERNVLFYCPQCDRVYQHCRATTYMPELKRSISREWDEYLTDFPKLQEHKICTCCGGKGAT